MDGQGATTSLQHCQTDTDTDCEATEDEGRDTNSDGYLDDGEGGLFVTGVRVTSGRRGVP